MSRKDHRETSPEGQAAKADAESADSSGQQVADNMAKENEQGFRGAKADPTPNEAYTVDGVTSGQPTPETDEGAADDAAKRKA